MLTKKKKQYFKAFSNSMQYHARHGMCTNVPRAESAGPLIVSEAFCACAKCLEFKHSECLAQRHVGVARAVEVPRKKGGASAVTQALALPAFVAGIEKGTTWAVAAAEDARAAEGKYWLARMVETPYQNPQEFTYCGELIDKDCYIAKIHWLRCVRRGAIRSYKEEREVKYLSMNAVIRTDGPVVLTKPPRGTRKGELDLISSDEQTRIPNAA